MVQKFRSFEPSNTVKLIKSSKVLSVKAHPSEIVLRPVGIKVSRIESAIIIQALVERPIQVYIYNIYIVHNKFGPPNS